MMNKIVKGYFCQDCGRKVVMVKKKDYMVCKGCLKSYPKTIKESLVTVGFFD